MLPALPDEVQPGEGPGLLPLGQPLGLTSSAHSEAAGLGDGFIYPDLSLKPGSRPPAEGPWERIWDHSQRGDAVGRALTAGRLGRCLCEPWQVCSDPL